MTQFRIDAPLSRLLLQAQGDPMSKLCQLPDSAFVDTAQEAGARIVAAVADLGYQFQFARMESEDMDDNAPGPRMPIARITQDQCAWADPQLMRVLAHDFGLDAARHGRLIGAMLVQFFGFIIDQGLSGDFGTVRAASGSGELSIDVACPLPA